MIFISIIRLICRRGTVMYISCGLASNVGVIRYSDGSEMACVAGYMYRLYSPQYCDEVSAISALFLIYYVNLICFLTHILYLF